MFSAKDYIPICSRIAIEADCTVFNVEYRLNPEHKSPKGILDGYAAFKWVIANAEKLGIDPSRICLSGESGGGYICTGVAMHAAKNDEAKDIKLLVAHVPMTSDEFIRKPLEQFDEYRQNYVEINKQVYALMATDAETQKSDPYIFPNLMGDELASKMPNTVVFSTEFDYYLGGSLELAGLLKKNGKLFDLCIHP